MHKCGQLLHLQCGRRLLSVVGGRRQQKPLHRRFYPLLQRWRYVGGALAFLRALRANKMAVFSMQNERFYRGTGRVAYVHKWKNVYVRQSVRWNRLCAAQQRKLF